MDKAVSLITERWQTLVAFSPRLVAAILVLVVSYVLGKYLAKSIIGLLRRTFLAKIHESFFKTLSVTISVFIGLVIALNIIGLEKMAVSVLAGGGVTAIVLGFAFREIGENFLAGIFLAFSRPFKMGDVIRTEEVEGKVQDIELRYTHLRTDDGSDVYVPSSQLFSKPLINYTKDGLRRESFSVGIDYANDASGACKLLQDTVKNVRGVLDAPEAEAYLLSLSVQFVEIEVFYWINVFDTTADGLAVRTKVLDSCRKALLDAGYTVSSETTTNVAITSGSANSDRQAIRSETG